MRLHSDIQRRWRLTALALVAVAARRVPAPGAAEPPHGHHMTIHLPELEALDLEALDLEALELEALDLHFAGAERLQRRLEIELAAQDAAVLRALARAERSEQLRHLRGRLGRDEHDGLAGTVVSLNRKLASFVGTGAKLLAELVSGGRVALI